MTKNTLYLLVTCCVEQSRYDILKQVVQNLKEEQTKKNYWIEDDLIVFDNGSNVPDTVAMLKKNFKHVVMTPKNTGFWSAIDWVLQNYRLILNKDYEYIYIIESDHIHFALEKTQDCERVLSEQPDIGGIKMQQYEVAQQHLYNKTHFHPNSIKHAWVHHVNFVTGDPIRLVMRDDRSKVYATNFLTCLHSFNRFEAMKKVFSQLRNFDKPFIEQDFQRLYHEIYPVIGLIDGGAFHAALGYTLENGGKLSGSWSDSSSRDAVGYRDTRKDTIVPVTEVTIQ